jgi:uncharacterized protein with PQ loop repeat
LIIKIIKVKKIKAALKIDVKDFFMKNFSFYAFIFHTILHIPVQTIFVEILFHTGYRNQEITGNIKSKNKKRIYIENVQKISDEMI